MIRKKRLNDKILYHLVFFFLSFIFKACNIYRVILNYFFIWIGEREAALHYEDDEFALICGDRFDDTVLDAEQQEVAQTESNEVDQKEKEAVEKVELSSQETLNASEKQDIKNS